MPEWTTTELKKAEKLWKEGKLVKEIAVELGRNFQSVNHQVKRDRERFPRRKAKWGSLAKEGVSFRAEISEFVMKAIRKEAKERRISINMIIREALLDRFVRKKWKPGPSTSTEKVKLTRNSREL